MSALDQPSPFEDGHRYQVLTDAEFAMLAHPRYVVVEVEGILTLGTHRAGLSCHVLNTANAHRIMAMWTTEHLIGGAGDMPGGGSKPTWARKMMARERAAERCAELNAEHDRFMAGLT